MDFNQFDSRAAGDRGAWMHVHSPVDGKPLHTEDSKPCRVRVLGIEGEIGQKVFAEVRKGLTGEDSTEDGNEKLMRQTVPLVVEFENINRGDKPAKAPEDVEWFLGLQRVVGGDYPSFVEQVRAFSIRRANVMGNAFGGSSKPQSKSVG